MSVAWYSPRSPEDALSVLRHGGTAVAGGAALLSPAFAVAMGDLAVDVLSVLPSDVDADGIGAAATLADLADSPLARATWPALAAAAAATATPLVRAVATVGGTVGARLLTSDLAPALAAHACELDVLVLDDPILDDPVLDERSGRSPRPGLGTLTLSAVDYLAAPPSAPHLVARVRPTRGGPGAYRRFTLRPGPGPAVATVAGVRTEAGVELWAGAVGPTPAPVLLSADLPAALPADRLRTDGLASAAYRSRLLRSLADEVRRDLAAPGGAA